jgi:hypothetical protein
MNRGRSGLAVAAIVTVLMGCMDSAGPTKEPTQFQPLPVSKLEAPATVTAGASVDVVLTVGRGACVAFDHISEVRGDSQITLAAWGRELMIPPGAACIGILIEEPHTYRLDPPFPSRFTILVQPVQFGPLLSREVQVQ